MKYAPDQILDETLRNCPELNVCRDDIERCFNVLKSCFASGGKLMVCGNGGSASDSAHIAGELMKGFRLPRGLPDEEAARFASLPENGDYLAGKLQSALPCIALTDNAPLSTAIANDTAADMAFAQQVYGYAADNDALIGISTSGGARNVINALLTAKALGVVTVGLTGREGGAVGRICDIAIKAPASETYRVQEYHLPIYHALCAMLEAAFFTYEQPFGP